MMALSILLNVPGCMATPGIPPDAGALFFPAGLVLDPRTENDETPASYLLAVNGNNNLAYNAGSVIAIDVDRFFASWVDDGGEGVYPFCEAVSIDADGRPQGRCVLASGSSTDDTHPCRRLALNPSVVECDERPFVVDSVRIGDFAMTPAVARQSQPRVFIPVRGDPSITYFDVKDAEGGEPDLDCGQERDARGRAADDGACTDAYRLTYLHDDPDLGRMPREPSNVLVTETEDYSYAFVAHGQGGGLTLVDLQRWDRPRIVDSRPSFFRPSALGGVRTGGFGLAARPCLVDEAPSVTHACTRPLVYGSLRWDFTLRSFSASGLDRASLPGGDATRDSCYGNDRDGNGQPDFVGQFCATPNQLGQPCAISCDPQVQNITRVPLLGLDPYRRQRERSFQTIFGDIAFEDGNADTLYVVQSDPGALLTLDTSLGVGQEPRNIPALPPIELCADPTRMKLWDGLAFVSCFQAAYVFVVDLRAHRVLKSIITGTGPHDLVVDPGRKVLFVANTLENSISVIDLDQTHHTRFTEIARIGLQDPFSS